MTKVGFLLSLFSHLVFTWLRFRQRQGTQCENCWLYAGLHLKGKFFKCWLVLDEGMSTLFVSQKINANNAFETPIFEKLNNVVEVESLQCVGAMLDASAKVYAYR
jgi:hypothetical protein